MMAISKPFHQKKVEPNREKWCLVDYHLPTFVEQSLDTQNA